MVREVLPLACVLALGCAARNPALTATPTSEELPRIADLGAVTPIDVAVAGTHATQPRLVPDFRPPPLTSEEQAVIGERQAHRKFLPFNRFRRFPLGVGTWFGGVSAAASGTGGPATRLDGPVSVSGVNGAGGAATAADPVAVHVSGVHAARPPAARAGPEAEVSTETDPVAKRISARRP